MEQFVEEQLAAGDWWTPSAIYPSKPHARGPAQQVHAWQLEADSQR